MFIIFRWSCTACGKYQGFDNTAQGIASKKYQHRKRCAVFKEFMEQYNNMGFM